MDLEAYLGIAAIVLALWIVLSTIGAGILLWMMFKERNECVRQYAEALQDAENAREEVERGLSALEKKFRL